MGYIQYLAIMQGSSWLRSRRFAELVTVPAAPMGRVIDALGKG